MNSGDMDRVVAREHPEQREVCHVQRRVPPQGPQRYEEVRQSKAAEENSAGSAQVLHLDF